MGRRKVTYKGAEKRPKNWVPAHRGAFIAGKQKIFENDQKFFKSIGWNYPNADFKPANCMHIDTSKINSTVWNVSCARGLVGNPAVLKNCQEKRIPGGSAFNAIWPGDGEVQPGYYSVLELDYAKCAALKKQRELDHCPKHKTPRAGPGRTCGISGTADTHEWHLEHATLQFLEERGIEKLDPEREVDPEEPQGYFLVQLDKSTCQSYNLAPGIFGFNGKPTKRTTDLLQEIACDYGVVVEAIVQPTHCFDLNACDALLHSCQKRKLRSYPAPLCREHIERDFKRMVREISTPRMLQRCFYRAYRRDLNGDIDKNLIPSNILDFYANSEDEDDTASEEESDVEYDDLDISDGEFDTN